MEPREVSSHHNAKSAGAEGLNKRRRGGPASHYFLSLPLLGTKRSFGAAALPASMLFD